MTVRSTGLLAGALVLGLVSVTACVHNVTGPVRTATTYEHKAAATAGSAASSVATVSLAVDAASRGQAFGSFLSVLVSDSEDELAATTSTFSAIQPPDGSSLEIRAELLDLLSSATDDVAAARIVIRGPGADLTAVSDGLNSDLTQLQAFEEDHR